MNLKRQSPGISLDESVYTEVRKSRIDVDRTGDTLVKVGLVYTPKSSWSSCVKTNHLLDSNNRNNDHQTFLNSPVHGFYTNYFNKMEIVLPPSGNNQIKGPNQCSRKRRKEKPRWDNPQNSQPTEAEPSKALLH